MFSWTSPPTAVGDFLYPNALAHDSGSLAFPGGMLPSADSDDGRAEALQRPGLSSITLWRRADPSLQTTFGHWHGNHAIVKPSRRPACGNGGRRPRPFAGSGP